MRLNELRAFAGAYMVGLAAMVLKSGTLGITVQITTGIYLCTQLSASCFAVILLQRRWSVG